MGNKNEKDGSGLNDNFDEKLSRNRLDANSLGKLLKNKKLCDELLNENSDVLNEFERKLRLKQSKNQQPQGAYSSRGNNNYYQSTRGDKPMMPSSRLHIDSNDPLLIATLPPPLTSVFTDNNETLAYNNNNTIRHRRNYPYEAAAAAQPPQAAAAQLPQMHMRNTFNVAKLRSHPNQDILLNIDRNYTDPWRNAVHKMAQNNATAATSKSKPTKSLLLQELLECPICMNRYDNPHVLPCQHTFCKSCIVTLKTNARNDENVINCPICRETHNLNNGIDNLPANYTMKRLIELEAMAAEKEAAAAAAAAAELLNIRNKIKHKATKPVINAKIQAQHSNSSFSSSQSGNKYVPKYHKKKHEHSTQTSDVESTSQTRLKLILLCHSSAIDTLSEINSDDSSNNSNNSMNDNAYDDIDENGNYIRRRLNSSKTRSSSKNSRYKNEQIYEDEYGKCKTFSKIGVKYEDRIEKIKNIIQEKFNIPYEEQLLVYKDKILKSDNKTLKHYHVRNYGRIHVFDKRDVKENLNEFDDIDPYCIDEDIVKELTQNLNSKKNVKHVSETLSVRSTNNIKTSSSNYRDGEKAIHNKKYSNSQYDIYDDGDVITTTTTDGISHSTKSSRSRKSYDKQEAVYSSTKRSNQILNDFKKHSFNYRRVRKLNEILDAN